MSHALKKIGQWLSNRASQSRKWLTSGTFSASFVFVTLKLTLALAICLAAAWLLGRLTNFTMWFWFGAFVAVPVLLFIIRARQIDESGNSSTKTSPSHAQTAPKDSPSQPVVHRTEPGTPTMVWDSSPPKAVESAAVNPNRVERLLERRPRGKELSRTVEQSPNGERTLVFCKVTKLGKKEWLEITQRLKISRSVLVDVSLVRRRGFEPISNETKIHCYTRLHWWSHGPAQILVVLGFLAVAAVLAYATWWQNLFATYPVIVLIIISPAFIVGYVLVWIKWAFTYLIMTDKRIMLRYEPPWIIPGDKHFAEFRRLQGLTVDEEWIGKIVGFKWIYSETTATETDAWLRKGIRHVHHGTETEVLISELMSQEPLPSGS